jgi:hypothetical protein
MAKRDRQFWESAALNNATFRQYYNRLTELSISMFEWKNLPDTVDPRYLELTLFTDGQAVFFKDEEIGFLALQNAKGGKFNVYRIPVNRRAYAVNGYQKDLTDKDSVIIFNNYLHNNSRLDVEMFARRLWNLDRAIDVNANAQKTPVLIQCDETQRLTMLNLYKKYDGNEPFIFGDKNLNPNAIKTLKTDAPYVADKLYQLKTQIWNEALTYLGISNINITKKERLITDEVTRNQGGTIASRYSRLEARRDACREINKMFGLDIWCDYREDYQALSEEVLTDGDDVTEEGGEPNE